MGQSCCVTIFNEEKEERKMKKEKATSVDDMIKKAAAKRSEAEEMLHADKVIVKASVLLLKRAEEIQKFTGKTPEKVCTDVFKVNGHNVEFSMHNTNFGHVIFGKIDGKIYQGDALKEQINRVDGIGLHGVDKAKHKVAETKAKAAVTLHNDAPVLRRTIAISTVRKAEAAARQASYQGENILEKLIMFAARGLNGPSR